MPSACCVTGCKSRGNGQQGIQFFQLPLNKPNILTQWLIVLDRRDWSPKPSSKICSLHFSADDYIQRPNTNVPRLKPDAIPSVFPDLSSTQDEAGTSPKSSSPEVVEANKALKTNKVFSKIATPVVEESPSGRPRRAAKFNSKMKDFILLDDIRKHRHLSTPGKATVSEKDTAAQELLSILEDSSSLSGEESNNVSKDLFNNTPKINLTSASKKPTLPNNLSPMPSSSSKVMSHNDETVKETNKSALILGSKKKQLDTDSSRTPEKAASKRSATDEVSLPGHKPTGRKVATKSTGGSVNNLKGNSLLGSLKSDVLAPDKKLASAQDTPSKPKNSKKEVPFAFRKTYYQIKEGEKIYYFSYADLNPFIDMTRNNVLNDQQNPPSRAAANNIAPNDEKEIVASIDEVDDSDTLDVEENSFTNNSYGKSKKNHISLDVEMPVMETPPALKRDYRKKQMKKRDLKAHVHDQETPKKEYKKRTLKNSNIDANESLAESDIVTNEGPPAVDNEITDYDDGDTRIIQDKGMSPPAISKINKNYKITSPGKRKKRFKTVAEIVVRTDNTGQVPSVSIDKINNFVDLENETTPVKKKPKTAYVSSFKPDFNISVPVVTTPPTEADELKRLSQRITETIKEMKLLEKVRGNASKLTVLITTLPPVQEKEILIITKKNIETNTSQTRELQVAISSYKKLDSDNNLSNRTNSSLLSGEDLDLAIVGACHNESIVEESVVSDANVGDSSSETPKKDLGQEKDVDASASEINSDDKKTEDTPHTDEKSPETQKSINSVTKNNIVQFGIDDLGSNTSHDRVNNSDVNIPENTESHPEDKTSKDAAGMKINTVAPLQHDHTYISPNLKATDEAEVAEDEQAKIIFSNLKLSEAEISFRRKVGKKMNLLKKALQKKNEVITKLRERVRIYESKMNDEIQIKKQIKQKMKVDEPLYDTVLDTELATKSLDFSGDLPDLENADESEEEERASSPITYICEPAIDVCEKANVAE